MSKEDKKSVKKICNGEKYYYSNGIYFLDTTTMDLVRKVSAMLQQHENVVKRVLEVKEQHPKQNYQFLASKLSKELGETLEAEDVKEIIEKARELVKGTKEKLKEMNDGIKDSPKYEIINDEYVIYTNVNSPEGKVKQVYRLPVELVDNIFNDYSRYGANMSGQAIMSKYDLKPKVWNLIKSNIGLYKDSNILSPLSMDNASKEGKVDEIIQEATYNNFQDKYKHKYKDAHITNLEKLAKKQAKTLGTIEGFLEQIAPIINSVKPLNIQIPKGYYKKSPIPVFHFGDTHIGKMDTDMVVKRIGILRNDIINHPSKEIYLHCLSDLVEAIMTGGMHPGQLETMVGVYGHKLFMYAISIFRDELIVPILKAGKIVHFKMNKGNHDRVTTVNEYDPERRVAVMFYELLKAYLKDTKTFDIELFNEKVGIFEVDGIQYISHHGEKLDKKNPEKIAWKFADTGKPVVIVSAHEHNEQIYTGKNVTHLKINALAGQNQYDKDLMLDSYPGYAVTTRNEFGLPDIYSKRLP